jgi:hypothetical protein
MSNKKTKNTKKHRNKLKNAKRDIDTTWADKVYSPAKVDEALIKKGYHTKGKLRGKVNTSTGEKNAGINNAMIDMSV